MFKILGMEYEKRTNALSHENPSRFPDDFLNLDDGADADTLSQMFLDAFGSYGNEWKVYSKIHDGQALNDDEQRIAERARLRQLPAPEDVTVDGEEDLGGYPVPPARFLAAERERLLDRGWAEPVWSYYGPLLCRLESQTRAAATGEGAELAGGTCPVYACGYDWRQSNADSARQLRDRIAAIREREAAITGRAPEDVLLVTHSMGGLVARSYLQQFEADRPDSDRVVAGVIHLNQPTFGAPVLYRRLKVGAISDYDGWQMKQLLGERVGFGDPYSTATVLSALPSVPELLPSERFSLLPAQHDAARAWLSWDASVHQPPGDDASDDETARVPFEVPGSLQRPPSDRPALFEDVYLDPSGILGAVPFDFEGGNEAGDWFAESMDRPYADDLRAHVQNARSFQDHIRDTFHERTVWGATTGHGTDSVLAITRRPLDAIDPDSPGYPVLDEAELESPNTETTIADRHVTFYAPTDGDGTVPLASQLGPASRDDDNTFVVDGPEHATACAVSAVQDQVITSLRLLLAATTRARRD